MLDSRGVIGQVWRNRLFLQAFPGGRDRCGILGKSRLISSASVLYRVLRHEVARLIVWHAVSTRPVVPSTVSYMVRQQGNAPSNAHGHSTHRHPTGTRTA